MLKHAFALTLAVLALAGCGLNTPGASTVVKSDASVAAKELFFRPVTIKDLVTMPYDDPKSIGTLVTFEASFGRERWTGVSGSTTDGYKLWDRDGHGIRCYNIYTEGKDASRDLNSGADWLLKYGTYVKIEGAYHPGYQTVGHAGQTYVEKSIDVYFINGKPVKDFVSK